MVAPHCEKLVTAALSHTHLPARLLKKLLPSLPIPQGSACLCEEVRADLAAAHDADAREAVDEHQPERLAVLRAPVQALAGPDEHVLAPLAPRK